MDSYFKTVWLLFLGVTFFACTQQNEIEKVTIGNQVWSSSNYKGESFLNGDKIPEVKSESAWIEAAELGKPAWCYYGNDASNEASYGKLYNWYVLNDARGFAPDGWRIPSASDWDLLAKTLGGTEVAGKAMKSISGWEDNGNGTNSSGFNGAPGGYRTHLGTFGTMGPNGSFWSVEEASGKDGWTRDLYFYDDKLTEGKYPKGYGFSIRLIKE